MKRKFLCLKNWKVDSGAYFKKDREYYGYVCHTENGRKYAKIEGDLEMSVNFHEGSEYFNI